MKQTFTIKFDYVSETWRLVNNSDFLGEIFTICLCTRCIYGYILFCVEREHTRLWYSYFNNSVESINAENEWLFIAEYFTI